MVILKLAVRNIIGAGLRTWLTVIVLSLSFVIIIWHKGLLDGWDRQAINDMISWEVAGGQYWNEKYDPYDPLSLAESHNVIPFQIRNLIERGEASPFLFAQGTVYPEGRLQSIIIKGVDPEQDIIELPSEELADADAEIPAIIGRNLSASTGLEEDDLVTLRWRDKNGAFDAAQVRIAGVFNTNVPSVDNGQIWIPLEVLREMILAPGEATIVVCRESETDYPEVEGWEFLSRDDLFTDLNEIIKSKTMAGLIIWAILLMVAMLAIFDTQVLSIFRRQKEIGTYIALGMTRWQVVSLFTIEGAMHSILATVLGALYGVPLLSIQATRGISLPVSTKDYGLAMAEKLYPVYSLALVAGTVIVVVLVTTLVSYWPSRKIARMKPTEALRGKIQ